MPGDPAGAGRKAENSRLAPGQQGRGRRARSGKEADKQAAGTAGAVMTHTRLPTTLEASADLRLPTGRRSKEARSLRRLGEELSQRGRTEPLKNRMEQQIRQENIIRGRGKWRTINKRTQRQEGEREGSQEVEHQQSRTQKNEKRQKQIRELAGTEHLYPYRTLRREIRALHGQTLQTVEAMTGNKPNHKPVSKPARQLLFSEALQHKRLTPTKINPQTSPPLNESITMSDKDHSTTMDRILQEITTVSRRIERMDTSITSLTLETKSMRADIAGFQSRVTGLEQRMGSLETQVNMSQEREQDFLYLRSKLTDMEYRSRRDNIRLLGIPENEEGSDMQAFLSSTLPKMT
ncbi:hypothetical protein NDU88_004896 [Pleurodeles waltl]|uniref:Uncharacterized protein n=1 Tax=Pleurodeles waltl TaxID=8319 RepID=A0AAV7WWE6_PLEWA|nr:hypothetical protein NDU88_004896 [Pleurodeles waltl]